MADAAAHVGLSQPEGRLWPVGVPDAVAEGRIEQVLVVAIDGSQTAHERVGEVAATGLGRSGLANVEADDHRRPTWLTARTVSAASQRPSVWSIDGDTRRFQRSAAY